MPAPALVSTHAWRPLVAESSVVRSLSRALAIEPLLATILVNRGLRDEAAAQAYLKPSVDQLHDPCLLPDMERAAARLAQALAAKEPILIYGDADVDGLAGTALLVDMLDALGSRPQVFVPNRAYDGYSFTERGVQHVLASGARVVVSVDNGTTAVEPIRALQRAGVDVIVTDHHLPSGELPPALALVNPRRADSRYPFAGLSGTGVAFKLACALASRIHERGRAPALLGQVLGEALAWVAMGTVADVMPLVGENRVLVSRGLAALPRHRHPGLAALCAVAGLGRGASARAEDIAFRLAPRLNAAARLGRSDLSVALVTATDGQRASELAAALDELNRSRQSAERVLLAELKPILDDLPQDLPAVCSSDDWSTGLLGLVAGRVARARGLPAVLVSFANGDPGKGSCRSAGGFDVHGALLRCAARLESHGGHHNAAGFSIRRAEMEGFRTEFLRGWTDWARTGGGAQPLEIEGEVPLVGVSTRFVQWLEGLQPFGEGNRPPLLSCLDAEVAVARRMGDDGSHLDLQLAQGSTRIRAVAFGRGALQDALPAGRRVDVVFHPKLNRWRGRDQAELEVVDLRAAGSAATLGAQQLA